jgi:hypothetical protein
VFAVIARYISVEVAYKSFMIASVEGHPSFAIRRLERP